MWEFKRFFCSINISNLRLILKSESTWPLLQNFVANRTRNIRPLLKSISRMFLNVVDEPIPNLPGFSVSLPTIIPKYSNSEHLRNLNVLKKLTGTTVSSDQSRLRLFQVSSRIQIHYRKGQNLPGDLSADTIALIQIEYLT